MLVELITLIPLNQPHHCVVKGSSYSKRGMLAQKPKSIASIIQKQKHLRSLSLRRIKDHLHTFKTPLTQKLLDLIPKLLDHNP